MNKLFSISTKVFYIILLVALIFGVGFFGFEFFSTIKYPIAYLYIYILIPLLILSFLVILILNFKNFGFLKGLRETSINIFTLMLCSYLIFTLQKKYEEKNNKINVNVNNKTELGISNITLIGRNAKSKIDTLAPNQNEVMIFKGRKINYETENDYENEISLLFYYNKKWREKKILSGINRWRVIDGDWEIKIYSEDSIGIGQVNKPNLYN